jgi:hypothetical protein
MTSVEGRSGRVESESVRHLVKPSARAKSANDSIDENGGSSGRSDTRKVYVTSTEVETVSAKLSGHERAVLSDVGRLGVLSGRQIQQLHYEASPDGGRLARKHLAELTRWRVVTRLGRSIGGERAGSSGHCYALGVAGQRMLHPNWKRYRQPWTPKPSFLRHAISLSQLYVDLRLAERSSDISLAGFDAEPACWRDFVGPGGSRIILKPDALCVTHVDNFEDRYFIEADWGTESGPRILNKAKVYVRYWQSGHEQSRTGMFPYVLWVAPDSARASFLANVLSGLPSEHWQLFRVSTMHDAASQIAAGGGPSINNYKEVNR